MIFMSVPAVNLRTMLAPLAPAGLLGPAEEVAKMLPLGEKIGDLFFEMGYAHIQASKPDTVGKA